VGIQNFCSSVEKYLLGQLSEQVKYFSTWKEKFCISKQPCNVLLLYQHQWNNKPLKFCCERCDLLCYLSNGVLFSYENKILFLLVKMSCFCKKACLVFHCCLYNKCHCVFSYSSSVCNLNFFNSFLQNMFTCVHIYNFEGIQARKADWVF